ncbi:hypothetical protein MMC12_002108 [Toensbergia leucococca]|nr:hypothetical protein [Toensbergia leucococca]
MKAIDDTVYEVDCLQVEVGGATGVVGQYYIKGSKIKEIYDYEGQESLDDATVNNLVSCFQLQSTAFDKRSFLATFKLYTKSVVGLLGKNGTDEDGIKQVQAGMENYMKNVILPNFENYECYTGESQNSKGMIPLMAYRPDGKTPYFTFWKYGLVEIGLPDGK